MSQGGIENVGVERGLEDDLSQFHINTLETSGNKGGWVRGSKSQSSEVVLDSSFSDSIQKEGSGKAWGSL